MAEIVFLEPFYGGSHKYFADGVIRNSIHDIKLLSLPGRFWKWRMESAGMEFARLVQDWEKPDLVVATNLMDLAQWKSFSGWGEIPHILYIHENQLDYPLSEGEIRDFHYVWKDYSNYLSADRLIFNSEYNRNSFIQKFKLFIRKLPDLKPSDPDQIIRNKSEIITPGCSLLDFDKSHINPGNKEKPPLFLWNHRWEHDKNPEIFFNLLKRLKKERVPFELALLGESYRDSPACFAEAETLFESEMVQFGFAPDRKEYEFWLQKADFVFSTANQENFGISMVEAMSAGTIPLLPNRLAYPEVLPREYHELCIYNSEEELHSKLINLIERVDRDELKTGISKKMKRYGWNEIIKAFDAAVCDLLN